MSKIKELFYEAALLFVLMLPFLFLFWLFIPKSDPNEARKTLTNAGYSNIEITGAESFTCGKKYLFGTKFKAVSFDGKLTSGRVCSVFFYASKISTDQQFDSNNYLSFAIILAGIVAGILIFFAARKLN